MRHNNAKHKRMQMRNTNDATNNVNKRNNATINATQQCETQTMPQTMQMRQTQRQRMPQTMRNTNANKLTQQMATNFKYDYASQQIDLIEPNACTVITVNGFVPHVPNNAKTNDNANDDDKNKCDNNT